MSAVPRASQILLVGQKIRQIRKSRHLTQSDLASRIGVTQSDLSRMENGEYKVGLDTLFRILQVFELSMSNFFEESAVELDPAAADATGADLSLPGGSARADGGTDEPGKIPNGLPFEDWAALSDESRREVREFIAFKKMQDDKTRTNDGHD
jgi:transcriptional regulator with XRE-family HTH domain